MALTGPAAADPITGLIAAAITSLGVTGTVAGVSIASIAASAIVLAVGVGLTLLFAPKPPKPENGSIAVQEPLPFRSWGYGTDKVPGAVMLKEESGGYLGFVAALNGHPISAFRSLYLNDDLVDVPVTSDGFITGVVSRGLDHRYQNSAVTIETHKGVVPETAASIIEGQFPTIWGASHRGDGIASLAMLCAPAKSTDFQTTYPYGAPAPAAVLDQALVFDPRDATQSPTAPTTWKFSDNPVLCLLHFRCFSPYGSARPYATAIVPTLARWIEAANVCDELAALKAGGTEVRYRVAGWMTTQQDRRTGEAAIRACADIWTVDRGDGSIDIEAGRYYEPDVIITDDDILAWHGDRGVLTEDRLNSFKAKYKSPANGYTTVETDTLDDTDDQARRPGPPRTTQVDLSWVPATGQASRLLKREFLRQKEPSRGTLTLGLSGLNAAFARRIRVQSNSIPRLSNIALEVGRPVINLMAGTVTINYVSSGPQIDVYDPSVDESSPPPVTQRAISVGLPVPANVAAVAEQNGASVYLQVSWDLPLNNGLPYTSLSYEVDYRLHDAGGGTPGPWVPQQFNSPSVSGTRVSVATGAVPTGVVLDVQVSSRATGASLSTASDIVEVSTALVAPGQPTNLSASGGTGAATISCTNPSGGSFAGIQFYWTNSGGTFASSSPLGGTVTGSPGGTTTTTDTRSAGTYTYYAAAVSGTNGAASAPAGPVSATIS